jgi:hypothetical protein
MAVAFPSSTRLIAGIGQRAWPGARSVEKLSIWSSRDVAGPRNWSSRAVVIS